MVGRVYANVFLVGPVLLALLLATGTIGFRLISDYPWDDAAFMTVTTVSTVGYREIHPLDTGGRIFASALILAGVGTFFYVLTAILQLATGGAIVLALQERRMTAKIGALRDHYILCGYGRVGEEVAAELRARGAPYVIIEPNAGRAEAARTTGSLVVEGDATEDDVLERARVRHARGLVAASDGDAQNTYITLTARALSSDLVIVARASHRSSEPKLLQAGADQVVSPYKISGRRMALSVLQPLIVDFMETVATPREGERIFAELELDTDSPLVGQTLEAACGGTSIVVLGIRSGDAPLAVGPRGDTMVRAGDHLIVMGTPDAIEAISPKVVRRAV